MFDFLPLVLGPGPDKWNVFHCSICIAREIIGILRFWQLIEYFFKILEMSEEIPKTLILLSTETLPDVFGSIALSILNVLYMEHCSELTTAQLYHLLVFLTVLLYIS